MLTLSKLSDDLLGLIFEKCEDFCAIFFALCNKRFYNLATAMRIDLRYRMHYILRHDSIAVEMLMMVKKVHGFNMKVAFRSRGLSTKKCGCYGKLCKECMWAEIIERWCKEKNVEMLSKINISTLPYDLFLQFPVDLLTQYGWETIDTYSDKVLYNQMGSSIRNYLVVCLRLRGAEFTKSVIQKHKLLSSVWCNNDSKELANFIVENFVDFSLCMFKKSTLIDKHKYLKNVQYYKPELDWAFRDITDVEEHLHIGKIIEKITAFIYFKRIDCIILCLRKKIITPELEVFLVRTDIDEILEAAEVDARSMIHTCISTGEYKNYPRWRSQYKEELELDEEEEFYIHQVICKLDTPIELIILACKDNPRDVYTSENYDAIMTLIKDINKAAYHITRKGMLKCLKRLIAQFGLTEGIYKKIKKAFVPRFDGRFSHAFIDYMYEIATQNNNLRMLTRVLGQAIISHYVEMVELLLPIAKFKNYMAEVIVNNDDRILFRKCRKYSNKWIKYSSKTNTHSYIFKCLVC